MPCDKDTLCLGLREIMAQINSKRMFSEADMRLFGNQLNKIEPCSTILFTASKFNQSTQFIDLKPESQNFYQEIFRWDQKLNIISFRERQADLKVVSERNGGIFYEYEGGFEQSPGNVIKGFQGLKLFINNLA